MDEETWRELRKKKLCYSCKESWKMGHQCMGIGKVHYIEVVSNDEDDDYDEGIKRDSGEPSHATEHEPFQDIPKGVTICYIILSRSS
jgi:hypothetical protein